MLIQPYNPGWVNDFRRIKAILEDCLQNNNISIEHIGSTSVMGLAAKDIIDIDIVFYEPASFREIAGRLSEIGYYHNGNQGIKDREVFKRDPEKDRHSVLDTIKHHLYACPFDSEELRRHLLFRDFLRENEAERMAYENLKYDIAEMANQDRKRYAELKEILAGEFTASVLRKANAGAKFGK